ncbi:MAG: alpha/beta hydrolase [Bacteroidales bacterium]|nr:alpha/beta hydrolase [Bacteroidales bacterium]
MTRSCNSVQKKLYIILIFISTSIAFTSSAVFEDTVSEDSCTDEKFKTAEPGTCLNRKAYRLLKALDTMKENPYNNDFAKRVIDVFEPRVFKTVDTIVSTIEYDVPVRLYYPTKSSTTTPTQVILFIHGGGFMFGSIEEYDMAVKKLARITGNIIVAVDYRLAPEHPFPAALNDLSAVMEWITQNREAIGGKNEKIIVAGDSAGANLATVLAIKSRDEGKDNILCQILYYPPTTFVETEFPSRVYFLRDERRTYLLTEEFLLKTKESYLPDSIADTDPYVSPLLADLTGNIPPALILNAEVDPLRDEGRSYAEKLTAAGQDVTYIEYEGIIHGFFNLYMIFGEGKESMKLIKNYINGLNGRISAP